MAESWRNAMSGETAPALLAGYWDGELLRPVAEINQRLLESLRASALSATGTRHPPRLLAATAQEWCELDALALQRLAGSPCLLLDAGFDQPERWGRLPADAVRDAAADDGYFAGAQGVALVRRALLFAWHLAHANRLCARVLLGMSARAADAIAAVGLQDLDALAERGVPWIRPRWEQQPLVWRQLLRCARQGSDAQLRLAQLRGLQLLAAEHIGARLC
jgi:hypothetical protein